MLPPLLLLSAYHGDWQSYEDALYDLYLRKIVCGGLRFHGQRVQCRRTPPYKGKDAGFWHITSEGQDEHARTPDLARCERLPWIDVLISEAERSNGTAGPVRWFKNTRQGKTNVVLWLHQHDFVVVLGERNGYTLLLSAYVLRPHRAKATERDWKSFWGLT